MHYHLCRNEYDVLQQEKENNILEQSNKVFSSELIDVRKVKKEIDWQKAEKSLLSLKEKGFVNQVNDAVLYRKIINPKEKTITYTLPIHFYTPQKPYHLIQQIVVNKDNRLKVQYLKIIPKSSNPDKNDIFKDPNNEIIILDEDLNDINSPASITGRIREKNRNLTDSQIDTMGRKCRVQVYAYEILCSNGGGHRVGQSCEAGYVNDAHYEIETVEHCFTESYVGVEGGNEGGGSVSGGAFADYQLNKLAQSPHFYYIDFLRESKHSLLLSGVRNWMKDNDMDNPNNIKKLNDKIGYIIGAGHESMFDDLETYNRRTPTVANQEVADYSIRVAKMFSYFLEHGTATDAKVMKHSIRYLDQNRFLSWEDYLSIFKGLSKIVSLYPNENWSEIEKALKLEKIDNPKLLEKIIQDWLSPNIVKPTEAFVKHEKLNRIYEEAKKSEKFKKYLQKFEPEASAAHLMFDIGNTKNNSLADTHIPKESWIKIIFNKNTDWNNRPEIVVAYAFIHEFIHAEMYRQLLEVANKNGSIDLVKLQQYVKNNNQKELFNEYIKNRYSKAPTNYQHNIMAKKYINVVVDFLKEMYGSNYTDKEYLTIAWMGVQNTDAWNNLPKKEREEYKKIWKEKYWSWKK